MSEFGRGVAIILAAGSGKRMGTETPKQFLPLNGKPALFWTLKAFEESTADDVILVVSDSAAEEYVRNELVIKYGFKKVRSFCLGGAERYDSVQRGLLSIEKEIPEKAEYVLIHDGARCLVTPDLIERTLKDAAEYGSGVAAMPVKDTIKKADRDGFALETLDRRVLFQMQTPQTFSYELVREAYQRFHEMDPKPAVTDDAEVVELLMGRKTFLSRGSYENLKLTTPEDLLIAEAILKSRRC